MTANELARIILRGLRLWVALLEQALGEDADDDKKKHRKTIRE